MSHSTRWPHDVTSINGQRETFKTVVVTIDKVFTNFGTGYSFVEDTTTDSQGRKPIWNMQGTYNNGKREDYAGPVYDAGDVVEVDLSLNPGRGSKIFYDVKRCAPVRDTDANSVTKFEAPAAAPKATSIDERISKGMAFNNLTQALACADRAAFFEGEDELDNAKRMWHEAMEDAMAGKTPFSRVADVPEEIQAAVAAAETPEQAVAAAKGEADPITELVETVPWDGPSVEDLKQKGVALMSSKWDTPIDAADELRTALGLPQDWSALTADQWQAVIDFAEAKE
jgi:hypothetical protein